MLQNAGYFVYLPANEKGKLSSLIVRENEEWESYYYQGNLSQVIFRSIPIFRGFLNNQSWDTVFPHVDRPNGFITITAEILARSLASFHCQQADRHMNL